MRGLLTWTYKQRVPQLQTYIATRLVQTIMLYCADWWNAWSESDSSVLRCTVWFIWLQLIFLISNEHALSLNLVKASFRFRYHQSHSVAMPYLVDLKWGPLYRLFAHRVLCVICHVLIGWYCLGDCSLKSSIVLCQWSDLKREMIYQKGGRNCGYSIVLKWYHSVFGPAHQV